MIPAIFNALYGFLQSSRVTAALNTGSGKTAPLSLSLNTGEMPLELKNKFESILFCIRVREPVDTSELEPYLTLESKEQRCEVNLQLAEAFFKAGQLEQAKVFIQRAWILSNFSPEVMPLYESIFSQLIDVRAVQQAYKRLGLNAAARGNIPEALKHFNSWQYAYTVGTRLEKYEYDFDILTSIDMLAQPYRFHHGSQPPVSRTRKIRLGYLIRGITEINSVLMSISHTIARFHDKSCFEIMFFAPESYNAVLSSSQGSDWLSKFKALGYDIVTGTNENPNDPTHALLSVGKQIYDARPDMLVTSAVLADFSHYFIMCLRPAPIIIGLVQGPLPLFAPPKLDWCIAWSKQPLMDTPVNCSLVELKMAWPQRNEIKAYDRSELRIPDDACVLMSGARPQKFQHLEHWQAISDLLLRHENAYYVVAGVNDEQIPFLNSVLPESIKSRVLLLGWRKDFLELLSCADIVIDTYPAGSGQVLVQAMSFGLPIVGHQNDHMKLYDPCDWSPIEQFITDSDMIVPRGDFVRLKNVVSELIDNVDYRLKIGKRLRALTLEGGPAEGVKQCEEIYMKVLEHYSRPYTMTV